MPLARLLMLVAGLLAAAAAGSGAPRIQELNWTPNQNERVPLAALCHVVTDRPTRAEIDLTSRDHDETIVFEGLTSEHDLAVLGVHADTDYELVLRVIDEAGGSTTSEPWHWTTPPVPDGFPPLGVTVSRPRAMEPGVTLMPFVRWPGRGDPERDFGAVVALDAHGDIVWFYEAPHAISEIKRNAAGNLLYYHGRRGNVVEMDMLGNVVRQWHTTGISKQGIPADSIAVDATTIHHDVQELPSGNLMALSTEVRRFERYPASETDPTIERAPAWVIGDVLIEFQPDGTVVDRWPLLDVLDPYRIGYDSLDTGFWQDICDDLPQKDLGRDWCHANAVDYLADEHAVLISSYHQDLVLKLDLETRQPVWIMSFPTGWDERWRAFLLSPVGDGFFPSHQHAARRTPAGTVLLFDNGTYRARPYAPKMPAPQSFSRAVEYAIDETTREFRELWAYGGRPDEHFFSPFLGEADWLPTTGNVLITDGARVRGGDGLPAAHPAAGHKWARVVEVTRTTPAEVVFEVVVDDSSWGWTVYRSTRMPSLYPARGMSP